MRILITIFLTTLIVTIVPNIITIIKLIKGELDGVGDMGSLEWMSLWAQL